MYNEVIPSPQIRQLSSNQGNLITAFNGLVGGDASACNFIFEEGSIPDVLCRIVSDAQPGSEIVFLVDKTGSMEDDIEEVRASIDRIIDCLPPGTYLAAASYGDRLTDGANWYTRTDLTTDFEKIRSFVNNLRLTGGGDTPESVFDGIWRTLDEMPWKDCSAPDKIIVMGDAEPHTGSKTMYSLEDVLEKARSICPNTEFHPVIVLDL